MTQLPSFDRTELSVNIAHLARLRDEVSGLTIFTEEEVEEMRAIAELVFRGKTNEMRASKPKVGKRTADKADLYGKAAYVWRMIGFTVARSGPLQCMPVCADFDLPVRDPETGRWSSKQARVMAKRLDHLVDAFLNCVPKSQWYGVTRWGRALGK